MAGAIIHGITSTDTFPGKNLMVYDHHPDKCDALRASSGVQVAESAGALAGTCGVVFFAVKPQNFPELLEEIKSSVTERTVLVSIAAGITTHSIVSLLGHDCPVIRAMPNTPLLIGLGATAVCRTENVPDDVFSLVKSLFAACGTVTELEEEQMNEVISVSGSSPAYFYLFADAMVKSAGKQGIDAETALGLICQTMKGSAEMLLRSGKTPEELIRMVSSKGGTTLKALDVFYVRGLERTVDEAMLACTKRAEELGG